MTADAADMSLQHHYPEDGQLEVDLRHFALFLLILLFFGVYTNVDSLVKKSLHHSG